MARGYEHKTLGHPRALVPIHISVHVFINAILPQNFALNIMNTRFELATTKPVVRAVRMTDVGGNSAIRDYLGIRRALKSHLYFF